MKARHYICCFCLAVVALLAGCGSAPVRPGAGALGDWTLSIVHVNDSHSNIDPLPRTLMLAAPDGQRVGVEVSSGGMGRVKALIDRVRASHANVLALHAGDSITGTLYFNRVGQAVGQADALVMRSICFDALTLGNHEFDKGDAALAQYIAMLHSSTCQTPVLSANLRPGPASALAGGPVQPSVVLERGGHRIGIVGITTALKTKESSSADAQTQFEDEARAAQREIDALRAQGVSHIVLLTHIGYAQDKALAAQLSGVDVVVGGDSHTLLGPDAMRSYRAGSPAGPYPTLGKDRDGRSVCIVQANDYAKAVGELQVRFDARGQVQSCTGRPHLLLGDDFVRSASKTAPDAHERASFVRDIAASGFLTPIAPDAELLERIKPYQDSVAAFKQRIVARAPQELCSRRVPGALGSVDYSRSSADCNALGEVHRRGGDIQQMVVQAYLDEARHAYGGADIALQSGGGARVPLSGDISAARVLEVLPFGNMLWRLQLSGAEVQSMIEDGLHATFGPSQSSGSYPYTAGLRFHVDARAQRGARASQLQVFDPASGQWQALDPHKTYRLFVLAFNAGGGDGYPTLASVPAQRRQDIGVLDADAFLNWIARQPKGRDGTPLLHKLPAAHYSTQHYTAP